MLKKQKIPSNHSHRYKHMYIFQATHIEIHTQNPQKIGFGIRPA
jgi:hypothetical protein